MYRTKSSESGSTSQIVEDHIEVLKDCLGITASYKLATVKESIRVDMMMRYKASVSSGQLQIPKEEPILTQVFRERYCKDRAAIEDAAFKQLEEQEEKQLRMLKRKQLEMPNQQPSQQRQQQRPRSGTGNFRNSSEPMAYSQRTFKDRPCRDYNPPRGCWRGEYCKFGHFLDTHRAAPTAVSGQPALAPAVSYNGVSHSTPAGSQR